MLDRQNTRKELIASFQSMLQAEDATIDSVTSWMVFLTSLVQNPDELSSEAVEQIGNMTSTVLIAAKEVGMGYENVIMLLKIADIVVQLREVECGQRNCDRK